MNRTSYYADDPVFGYSGRIARAPHSARRTVLYEEPSPAAKPVEQKPRPVAHLSSYTVDKAGFELVVTGPFGIPHGTTGWRFGQRYIFDRKWQRGGSRDGNWLSLDEYRLAKLTARAREVQSYRSGSDEYSRYS